MENISLQIQQKQQTCKQGNHEENQSQTHQSAETNYKEKILKSGREGQHVIQGNKWVTSDLTSETNINIGVA